MRLRNIVAACSRHPWAVREEVARLVMDIVAGSSEREAAVPTDPPDGVASAGATAIIPIRGVIAPRANMMTQQSGMTSTDQISAWIDRAATDPSITRIVFDVDSPGGQVAGVPELAEKIFALRGVKPTTAIANFEMASAAYWLGSAAETVVAAPSSEVGSVGVVSVHADVSGANEKQGVKYTIITAGPDKALGNPYEPLNDSARAYIQDGVNEAYAMFVNALSRYRGVPVASVVESFGGGRMMSPAEAMKRKMIDRIGTMEEEMGPRKDNGKTEIRRRRTQTWEAMLS